MKYLSYMLVIFAALIASCENSEWEFEDYEYQAVYFAHQYPIRTITLGEDIFDTSLDNQWKFNIMATTAGVYENKANIMIDVQVNNAMVDGFVFDAGHGGGDIMAMPSNYYTLSSEDIFIEEGNLIGGVEVQLTQAFFDDPLAIQNTYVIPMQMISVTNADSILSGASVAENPRRGVAGDWSVQPKDFVFYAVKYINPWHGFYLRRGLDEITNTNGNTDLDQTIVRHNEYVEDDEVKMLNTEALDKVEYPLTFKDANENNINVTLILTFDDDENRTVSSGSDSYTATGSGSFVKDGEKNSWGNQDRDALYLSYEISLDDFDVQSVDTLVMRNRGVVADFFNPVVE